MKGVYRPVRALRAPREAAGEELHPHLVFLEVSRASLRKMFHVKHLRPVFAGKGFTLAQIGPSRGLENQELPTLESPKVADRAARRRDRKWRVEFPAAATAS